MQASVIKTIVAHRVDDLETSESTEKKLDSVAHRVDDLENRKPIKS